MLLEPTALAKPEIGKQFIVLDARARKAFDENRVPGARWVDAAAWAKAFGSGKDAEAWSRRIGDLGIDRDAKVVVYDSSFSKDAARIWWILRYWGVADVRLLNGGWAGWKAAGLPIEADKPQPPAAKTFQATPQSKRLATKGQLLASLKDKTLQIVDARSEGEFCGTDKQKNKRAGAIPGARHLEWIDLIDKKDPTLQERRSASRALSESGRGIGKAHRNPLPVWWPSGRDGLCDGVDGGDGREQLLCKLGRVGQRRRYAHRRRAVKGEEVVRRGVSVLRECGLCIPGQTAEYHSAGFFCRYSKEIRMRLRHEAIRYRGHGNRTLPRGFVLLYRECRYANAGLARNV